MLKEIYFYSPRDDPQMDPEIIYFFRTNSYPVSIYLFWLQS